MIGEGADRASPPSSWVGLASNASHVLNRLETLVPSAEKKTDAASSAAAGHSLRWI